MGKYQIIMIALWILLVIILGYDLKRWIQGNYNYHVLRIFVVILLVIGIIYDAKCWDDSREQQNAKKFNQHFEIERADEKYITKFQQEFLQNIIDVKMKNNKSKQITLIPLNNKGYISLDIQTNQFEELETNHYFKRNKEKFKKSLKNNPIKTETLIKILKNDLNDDFAVTQETIKESNGVENQWIVISWK